MSEKRRTRNKNSRANWVFFTDKGRLTNSFSNHFKKASKLRAINRGWKMSLFYGLFLCLTVPNVSKWIVRLQPSSRICGFIWSGGMLTLVISFTSFNVFNLFKSRFGLKERSVLRYSCDIFLSPNPRTKFDVKGESIFQYYSKLRNMSKFPMDLQQKICCIQY